MRTLSPQACAEQLALQRGELRGEFRLHQVSPAQSVWLMAYVPIREGHVAAVDAFLAAGSDWLRNMLKVRDSEVLRAHEPGYYDELPGPGPLLVIGHATDRTCIGHGDVVEALRTLAPHLLDARFFIQETDSDWLDEIRIAGGALSILRRVIEPPERYEEGADQLLAVAWEREDPAVESLVGRLYVDSAEDETQQILYAGHPDERRAAEARARARIGDAAGLAGSAARALAARAWLELTLAAFQTADADARAALAQEELPLARYVALAVAFAQGRDAEALDHAEALARRAPFFTEGLVAGLTLGEAERFDSCLLARPRGMVPPFQERAWVYLFDTLRVAALAGEPRGKRLDGALLAFAQRAGAAGAKDAAMLLFGWGEQLRLVGLHAGDARAAMHARARRMMDAALALTPLGNEAVQRRGFIKD